MSMAHAFNTNVSLIAVRLVLTGWERTKKETRLQRTNDACYMSLVGTAFLKIHVEGKKRNSVCGYFDKCALTRDLYRPGIHDFGFSHVYLSSMTLTRVDMYNLSSINIARRVTHIDRQRHTCTVLS